MKRLAQCAVVALVMSTAPAAEVAAQEPECQGTSGAANIGGVPWLTNCVFASTRSDCSDSTGAEYECFAIFGSDILPETYSAIAIFLAQPPVQGNTYPLGGTSGNGAVVFGGGTDRYTTANDPYVGTVHVSVYDQNAHTIECTFAFLSRRQDQGGDLNVTDGTFSGLVVAITPTHWSGVKQLYR